MRDSQTDQFTGMTYVKLLYISVQLSQTPLGVRQSGFVVLFDCRPVGLQTLLSKTTVGIANATSAALHIVLDLNGQSLVTSFLLYFRSSIIFFFGDFLLLYTDAIIVTRDSDSHRAPSAFFSQFALRTQIRMPIPFSNSGVWMLHYD